MSNTASRQVSDQRLENKKHNPCHILSDVGCCMSSVEGSGVAAFGFAIMKHELLACHDFSLFVWERAQVRVDDIPWVGRGKRAMPKYSGIRAE